MSLLQRPVRGFDYGGQVRHPARDRVTGSAASETCKSFAVDLAQVTRPALGPILGLSGASVRLPCPHVKFFHQVILSVMV
jgi:hypothetical protein